MQLHFPEAPMRTKITNNSNYASLITVWKIIIYSTSVGYFVQRIFFIYKLKLEHLVYTLSRRICIYVYTWKSFQVERGWFYSITSTMGVRARLFSRALLLDQSRNLGCRVKFIHGSDNRVKVCFTYRGEVFFGPSRFFSSPSFWFQVIKIMREIRKGFVHSYCDIIEKLIKIIIII